MNQFCNAVTEWIAAHINSVICFSILPKPPQNCRIQIKLGLAGCARASGNMVGSFGSDSDPWGHPGARVITICVFYVGPHFPYIEYFEVYGSI